MKLFNKVAAIAVGVALATGVGAGIVLGSREYAKAEAAGTASIVFANEGLENGVQYSDPFDIGNVATVTFAGGGNDGKYYTTGSGIRTYGGGTITIAPKNNNEHISMAAFTWSGSSNAPSDSSIVNEGTYSTSNHQWSGSSTSLVLTRPSGNGHWRLQSISVTTIANGGSTVDVTGVTVSPDSTSVVVGGTTQLTATVAPNDATNKTVTWSSDSESTATVSSDGKVTGVDVGSATITAKTADGGFESTCSVSVTLPAYTTDTVAQAIAHANALGDGATSAGYYKVTGYVVTAEDYDTGYGNITFTIADEKDGTPTLKCFRVNCSSEVAATILKDAKISLIGKLEKYVKNEVVTQELVNSLPSQITIIESGTPAQTYVVTFAEALDILEGLTPSSPTYDKYTIQGVVKEITYAYNNGQISFDIAATIDGTDLIRVYNLALTEQQAAQVEVGATIRVTGHLEVYNSTNELIHGESFELVSAPVAVTYTISYLANGGTGTMSDTVGAAPEVAACTFTAPAGKEFVKWNDSPDGTGNDYAVGATVSTDVTLYAIWAYPIIDPSEYFVKITSTSDISSDGKYLIAYEGLVFDGSLNTLDASQNTKEMNLTNLLASYFTIDGGSIKSASGYYIGQTSDANGLKTSDTDDYTNTISFDENGNLVVVSSGAYLRYNKTSGQERFRYFKSSTYTSQQAIQLYKVDLGKVILGEITCNELGTSQPTGSWSALESYYNTLSTTEKNSLKSVVANVSGTSIQKAMAKYDYIVGKYLKGQGLNTYKDFIGRNPAAIGASRSLSLVDGDAGTAAAMVVVVMSAISVTAVGGFFLLKKKPF